METTMCVLVPVHWGSFSRTVLRETMGRQDNPVQPKRTSDTNHTMRQNRKGTV